MKNKEKINDYHNIDEMATAHRGVLKSLVDKDGYYKSGEAKEINNAFGKQVSLLALKLEAFKLLREIPKRGELFLPSEK
jgi:hypothetical protein